MDNNLLGLKLFIKGSQSLLQIVVISLVLLLWVVDNVDGLNSARLDAVVAQKLHNLVGVHLS